MPKTRKKKPKGTRKKNIINVGENERSSKQREKSKTKFDELPLYAQFIASAFELTLLALPLVVIGGVGWGLYAFLTMFFSYETAVAFAMIITGILLATIWKLGWPTLRGWLKLPQPKRSEVVTENYLTQVRNNSLLGASSVAILSIWLALRGDVAIAILSSLIAISMLGHWLLTLYRVRCGLFGTTGQEACELITFIIERANNSDSPPGSRLSSGSDKQKSFAMDGEAQPAGAAS